MSFATLDEFENWSIAARELDDENGLDDIQRAFGPWHDWEWREYRNGARVGMGCATTETWEINMQAKLRHQVGKGGEVTYSYVQEEELGESVNVNEFGGSYRTSGGFWAGADYRPSFAKELHSAGIFVGYRRSWQRRVRLRLGFEDFLNNFWDGRTRWIVDKRRRVYENPPLEWELLGRWKEPGAGQAVIRGVLLPRYVRSTTPAPSVVEGGRSRQSSGWLLFVDLVHPTASSTQFGVRSRIKGADRTDTFFALSDSTQVESYNEAGLRDFYLRPWLQARVSSRLTLRAIAQGRWSSESHLDGRREHRLETRHLGGLGSVVIRTWKFLDIEVGAAFDQVGVDQDASVDREVFTHGDRVESRGMISLDFHAPGVRLVVTETIEGNNEGYQTLGFHDKGFAHIVIQF